MNIQNYLTKKHILYSKDMMPILKQIQSLTPRVQVKKILDFLHNDTDTRIAALFGCHHTGKTTILLTAISMLPKEEQEKSIYILGRPDITIDTIILWLDEARNKEGIRYAFIDEVTDFKDFGVAARNLDSTSLYPLKIVLTASKSYLLWLTFNDALRDSDPLIGTSRIPYREWSTIFEGKSLDDYCRNGGTMFETFPFPNNDVEQYILTSYSRELAESIANFPEGSGLSILAMLNKVDLLTPLTNYIIKRVIHSLFLNDVAAAATNFRKGEDKIALEWIRNIFSNFSSETREVLQNIFIQSMHLKFGLLSNSNKDFIIDNTQLEKLTECLEDIDVLRKRPQKLFGLRTHTVKNSTIPEWVLTQPCVRYQMTVAIKDTLLQECNSEANSAKDILHEMEGNIREHIIEECLFLDINDALTKITCNCEIFKAKFSYENDKQLCEGDAGEIDIVVHDIDSNMTLLFECKTGEWNDSYIENITSKKINETLEKCGYHPYGRFIICQYEAKSFITKSGIAWDRIEISQFLQDIWKDPKIKMEHLIALAKKQKEREKYKPCFNPQSAPSVADSVTDG